MKPIITDNRVEFQAALREYLSTTSRTLEEATNSRLSFVLKRAYEILFPKSAAGERKRIRDYLNAFALKLALRGSTAKRSGRKTPRRIYKIVQARRTKDGQSGLYGEEMKKAVGKFRLKAINSVGYLAAPVAAAWIAFGRARGAIRGAPKQRPQRTVTAYAHPAKAGLSPEAAVDMMGAFAGDQTSEVTARVDAAFDQSFALETVEIRNHLAKKMKADGVRYGLKPA